MRSRKKTLSEADYIAALNKMKESPDDRVGTLGELGALGLGGIAGAGVSGTVATAAGAATLFGSSTAATVLGGIFVTATPIGWVALSIGLGGAVGFGISKLVKSGAKNNVIKTRNMKEIKDKIQTMREEALGKGDDESKTRKIIDGIELLYVNKLISQEESTDLLSGLLRKTISVDRAFSMIESKVKKIR
jgi:hypothetical protein